MKTVTNSNFIRYNRLLIADNVQYTQKTVVLGQNATIDFKYLYALRPMDVIHKNIDGIEYKTYQGFSLPEKYQVNLLEECKDLLK